MVFEELYNKTFKYNSIILLIMGDLPIEKIKREVLVRKEAKTSEKFGVDADKRPVKELLDNGIVVIDKPSGPTSHQVSAYVQKILGLKKTGHSGTLDPKVTGVLPIALGSSTKIVQALLPAGKEYVCLIHIHKEVSEKDIKKVMRQFVGKIKQLPPIKSSVKRQWRYRKIYYIDVLNIKDQDVLFKVGCQAGTYIRKLCFDMGKTLGCGAHMAQLIRTKVAFFNDKERYTLQDLTDAFHYYKEGNETYIRKVIKPVEAGVAHLPKVWVFDTTVDTLCHGASLKVRGISKVESEICEEDLVAVMTLKNELIGLGVSKMLSKDMISLDKGVAVKVNKVFMNTGVYPRIERK